MIKNEHSEKRVDEGLVDTDFPNKDSIDIAFHDLESKGSSLLNHVYTDKEIRKMKNMIQKHFTTQNINDNVQVYAIRQLLIRIPKLKHLIFNPTLERILSQQPNQLFLSKALFFDKPPASNWYVTWHQDLPINVKEKVETEGFYGWTKKGDVISVCPPQDILQNTVTLRIHLDDTDESNGSLKVILGSHTKIYTDDEIAFITKNAIPHTCEVKKGSIHLMKPLLLHCSSKIENKSHRRVIHLEFNSTTLPNGLEWSEKQSIS